MWVKELGRDGELTSYSLDASGFPMCILFVVQRWWVPLVVVHCQHDGKAVNWCCVLRYEFVSPRSIYGNCLGRFYLVY